MIKLTTRCWTFIKDLVKKCIADEITTRSAELAYYFMLSLFPFLLVLTQLTAFIPISNNDFFTFLKGYAPPEAIAIIQSNLQLVVGQYSGSTLSIGVIATIWAASNGIDSIIRAFNKSYEIINTRNYFVSRAISALLMFIMIFVIIFVLLIPVFGKVIAGMIVKYIPGLAHLLPKWGFIRWVGSFIILFIVFTVLYSIGPTKIVRIKYVVFGSLFSTIGWIVSSFGFAIYVENFGNFTVQYGSLGGIIILMIWFFISAIVIIIGNEINALLMKYRLSNEEKPV